ncbi:MAG TPA: 2-isopropylmalate synthase [Candidatus Omnitrophica bacterium]|nr:2-isopropylmalate synthase [Candidatus Omnitrophota bacterium]
MASPYPSGQRKILIFDTTLRDGEQSPGASLTMNEKLMIARQLARLNVDVIEAGFPIASEGEFNAVRQIAQQVKGPIICGLARATKGDIDAAWNAIKHSEKPRIHTFIATSQIHLEKKLRKSKEEIIAITEEAVAYAKSLCKDVEFSPEDAARTDVTYMCDVVRAAIKAGATTVNIPDTVGYAEPEEFGSRIRKIFELVPEAKHIVISCHCHNDLGLAVANSLAAIQNGATQVECTVNGIGERAGNASMEEIVMNLRTRKDYFRNFSTGINTKEIYKASRMVADFTGIAVQRNKAIVGANAFAHEAGIHQDGVLKEKLTYEIMRPEDIGRAANKLVMGKHSGRAALVARLKDLGFELDQAELGKAFKKFKDLADKKKEIFDEDLMAIVQDEMTQVPETYALEYLHTISGTGVIPSATIKLRKEQEVFQDSGVGDGPVDAVLNAIDAITGLKGRLQDYQLRAITGGRDAIGEVSMKVDFDGTLVTGKGSSTDVIEASARAYVNALNRLVHPAGGQKLKEVGP